MLPLSLLNASQTHPILVELKGGDTLNGHLLNCDAYMNLTLKAVIHTSPDGAQFIKLPECYVRGNNIKYLRVADDIVELAKEREASQRNDNRGRGMQRGAGSGYGMGRGGAARGGPNANRGGERGGRFMRRGGGQFAGRAGRGAARGQRG